MDKDKDNLVPMYERSPGRVRERLSMRAAVILAVVALGAAVLTTAVFPQHEAQVISYLQIFLNWLSSMI